MDVLMVWHAYMLNPGWYAEDCTRVPILKTLQTLGDWFLPALVRMGDLSQFKPTPAREKTWQSQTRTPFDPLEAAAAIGSRTVECPECLAGVESPFLTDAGTGYAQPAFTVVCEQCKFVITKEKLGVAKLVRDVVRDREVGHGAYLAGTLHTQTNAADTRRASNVKNRILQAPSFKKSNEKMSGRVWEKEILSKMDYSMPKIQASVAVVMKAGGGRMARRILAAYTDDRPFSIDLVGAVVRQCSYVDKMYALGWTGFGFFDDSEDARVLIHATARYHAFLDLMASSPTSFFVPTLDIDLVWHSHQLTGSRYENDCLKYVGRHIDHDDKVEETLLATSFDVTCRAWQQRFNVPYMHCGCPLPGATIGERLGRLARLVRGAPHAPPASLQPPDYQGALAATHPSDHNAVRVRSGTHESARERRGKGAEKRRTTAAADAHCAMLLVPVPLFFAVVSAPCAAGIDTLTRLW
ncbi:hypothetical protein AcW1_006386 [Taiwanofungus camphoratus]|nr:hypothetical protein AcW1_006386 [Antrodia cinnamomea]